ncbi:S9 family peptidase [Flavobacterium ranwuense]|uniref:S9 family peptidase n=1 Tax=Flavobacterium ranwuense TaxID=2541725 RepID=A0ABY2DRA3_9FLAO|nr:prolyl oligopeptidase family serine peptidase [Flavobacterium ranwuense]TDE29295.1 S9 family peptidase [Flavobacterium ranwuense]
MKLSFLPIVYGVITIILIGLVPCPVIGQVLTKKQLTEADYHLWGTMGAEQLSEKGNWISYRMSYELNVDTLFVKNTKTYQRYVFADGSDGRFGSEPTFAYKMKNVLVVVDLETGKENRISAVERYDFSADGRFLVTLEKNHALVVRKNGKVLDSIENVREYNWNDESIMLVYATLENGKGTVGYLDLRDNYVSHLIVQPTTQHFEVLKWQHKGKTLAFYGVTEETTELYYYDSISGKLSNLKSTNANYPAHIKITPDQNIALNISRDGKKVFFGITNIVAKDTTVLSGGVAIWNAKDKMLYPDRKLRSTVSYPEYLAFWDIENGVVRQLSTAKQSWAMLTGKQDYALVADPYQYEPQYKWIADMDYYLLNLETGTRELFLTAQSGYMNQMGISPDGRYITYYRESNWWVYDIKKKTHTNVTKGLDISWDNRANDPGNEINVWGQPGWTTNGNYAIYYDYYDIWVISPDGTQRKRLTQGREIQLRFRLDASAIFDKQDINYSGVGVYNYDLSKDVLLTTLDMYSSANGYYLLHPNKGVKPFIMDGSSINKLQKAKGNNAFIYVTQKFDSPPCLRFRNGNTDIVMVQSNHQHKHYQWGKSEMIHYKDSKGNPLNGALFYPANYDATKKYPMIVYIYEIVSRDVNQYVNPSIHNTLGFNITNMTANGYAVLLADIALEKGNPGLSAVDCVTSAVNKIIDMGITDARKIGLMGHSFGAYETNFIITQTNMFAVAISGSGVSDTMQHYFTINTDYNTIDGWRYENQQYRMGYSFFENQEGYYRNSPLLNASKINTPLLTWAGKLDKNVQPRQAETFYAALRRLKKESVMLVYPNDGHILFNPKNQEDLTLKVQDWFGYYLKGEPKAKWMKADNETN